MGEKADQLWVNSRPRFRRFFSDQKGYPHLNTTESSNQETLQARHVCHRVLCARLAHFLAGHQVRMLILRFLLH